MREATRATRARDDGNESARGGGGRFERHERDYRDRCWSFAEIRGRVSKALGDQAWNLLSIFVSTVTGLVLKPMPVGAWAFGALTVALATKTLTFTQGLSAITNEVVWLIVVRGLLREGVHQNWIR